MVFHLECAACEEHEDWICAVLNDRRLEDDACIRAMSGLGWMRVRSAWCCPGCSGVLVDRMLSSPWTEENDMIRVAVVERQAYSRIFVVGREAM